jgi:hypothetical protein
MQAGACDYLATRVFPLGIDVRGALSVRDGGGDFPAQLDEDSPVECHDGSLAAFADRPRVAACVLTQLAALLDADPPRLAQPRLSPDLSEKPAATCQDRRPRPARAAPDDSDTDSDSQQRLRRQRRRV